MEKSKKRIVLIGALIVLVVGVLAFVYRMFGADTVIVIGDESDRAAAEVIKDAMGGVRIVKDTSSTNADTEILVGNTNRELSVKDSAGIREGDAWIRCYEGAVVIQGSNSEKLQKAAEHFVENYVPGWENGEGFPTDSDGNYYLFGKSTIQRLAFDESEIYEYSIVTKDGKTTEEAKLLQDSIKKATSYELPIVSKADLKDGQKAIIYGSSAARDAATKCKELDTKQYLIEATEDAVYLCAYDEAREYIVNYMFIGETMGYQINANTVAESNVEYFDYRFKFTTQKDDAIGHMAMTTEVASYPPQGEKKHFNVSQGACTDGTYLYNVMEDQVLASLHCVIMKIDPKTWEVVEVSDPLPIDHGNSITYLPQTKQFMISNCKPDGTLVSYVDAETLTYLRTVQMPYPSSSYFYNEELNQYVAYGQNKTILILDENLKVLESYNGVASSFTTQGYACDAEYIYPINNATNQIQLVDWEGHWLDSIKIDVSTELEYIVPMPDGELYYTTFFNQGVDINATIFYKTIYD